MTALGEGLIIPFIKSLIVSCLMGAGCYLIYRVMPIPQSDIHTKMMMLLLGLAQVMVPLIAGIGLYLGFSYVIQPQALKQALRGLGGVK